MAFSPGPNDRAVALDVFGGYVSDIEAADLPLGVSPDCPDVEFFPGSVKNRRCLRKIFASPLYPTKNRTYGKSYVDPKGVIRNLYFYDNGAITVENVTSAPGVETLLSQTSAPGCWAKSITAFGREYLAISDGTHGAEIPLHFDGTNLDRVTQDGPGTPPTVASLQLPSVAMATTSVATPLTITTVTLSGFWAPGGYYTTATFTVASGALSINVNSQITIAGNTNAVFNGTGPVLSTPNDTTVIVPWYSTTLEVGTGGTMTITTGVTMTRLKNVVTVKTTAAHKLQVGYQAQITNVPAATIGTSISSIVINNENLPGVATVTTSSAHGLIPGLFVSLKDIDAVTVGTSIVSITRAGQVVTVETATDHNLSPGASITTSGVTTASFNTTALVAAVNSATVFTFNQADTDASDSTGTVAINWPIPISSTPSFFEVLSAPTDTSFQVALNYSNSPSGGWTTGTVQYAWNGTFFVATVPTTTSFTYQQYGPDTTTSSVGTVTPYGQIAPGIHQLQVAYQTRQGYITAPSPPVSFTASGGQYVQVNDIPIGPTNVVARLLLFTGANGSLFYYIPSTPQINGQIVGTQTAVNDNTTISVVLDFSDNTLFASLGTSIQGNNIANQITMEGALGFGYYASRLFTYGQRNRVGGLLNTGFDGGHLPSATTLPTGWVANPGTGGALAAGHFGEGWSITVTHGAGQRGKLTQGFYEDAYGAPIATGDTQYKLRVWLKSTQAVADIIFTVSMTSASTGFSATANITGNLMNTSIGSFLEATFSAKTPVQIPTDFKLNIYALSTVTDCVVLVDEISIIYSDSPYLKNTYWSYANNPEAFDGVSGLLGPVNDTRAVFDSFIERGSLYLLTQDPAGRLHDTSDNGVSEPSGWTVNEIAANCGTMSTFALTVSQADDSSAAGGEEWAVWMSTNGAMIFAGGNPDKISQEIAPDWGNISPAHQTSCWALNDYVNRIIYFGLTVGEFSTPTRVFQMSYRELNTAYQIANSPPIRIGGNGALSATDLARKWSPWQMSMNAGALMYTAPGSLAVVLMGGNGLAPNVGTGHGNAYTLSAAKLTDDDYGQVSPYYVTAAFVGHDLERGLQLGMYRKMVSYLTSYISSQAASSNLTITVLVDRIGNPWALSCARPLLATPNNDLEWNGGCAQGQRFFIKLAVSPKTGTNNAFNLQHLVVSLRTAGRLPVRGAAQS